MSEQAFADVPGTCRQLAAFLDVPAGGFEVDNAVTTVNRSTIPRAQRLAGIGVSVARRFRRLGLEPAVDAARRAGVQRVFRGAAIPRIDPALKAELSRAYGEEFDELESPAVIVMVETSDGLANVDEIASTAGVDAIYVGPADLSIALGVPWQRDRRTPDQATAHADAVERIRQACDRAGIVAGMNCSNGDVAGNYVAQGFRMVTVTVDADMIPRDGMRELARAKEVGGH